MRERNKEGMRMAAMTGSNVTLVKPGIDRSQDGDGLRKYQVERLRIIGVDGWMEQSE